MLIKSIASLPVFDKLNEGKVSKEEIYKCLMKENYEQYNENRIIEQNDDTGMDTDKNKEKSREDINSPIDNTDLGNSLYDQSNKNRGCC